MKLEEKIERRERIGKEEALSLMRENDILLLGRLADTVRKRKSGNLCYYSYNININPTNICIFRCPLCAFSRDREDGYLLSLSQIEKKVRRAHHRGIREVHIVGGCHPDLKIEYYEEMFYRIKEIDKDIFIQALTAPEIVQIAKTSSLGIKDVLLRLKKAGLGSIPGGGAEIFSERARKVLCPNKISAREWLSVAKEAHECGIATNATMLFGSIETDEEIVDHLIRLRDLQDRTGGFCAFVPLSFHSKNTKIPSPGPDGVKILKVFSISRIILDNFDHIKGLWIYLGKKLTQVVLSFGVDDIGGTGWDERIVRSAGGSAESEIEIEDLVEMIKGAGRDPILVNSVYQRMNLD
jgi:aminodeoxyfutalosine synthase